MLDEDNSQMPKKIVIILISILVLAAAGGAGYWFVTLRNTKNSTEGSNLGGQVPGEKLSADLLYQDASGFSFKYPKSLKVSDVTPADDDSYYSRLELVKGEEKLTIAVKDDSVDSFIKGATLTGATTLGGISAKQYGIDQKLITIASSSGVIYLIEGPKDAGFWEEAQGVVVSTFTLGEKSASEDAGGSSGDNTIYEPEEVVE